MGFCNTSKDIEYIQKQVVIPTHMWASATAGMQAVEDVSKVVIPTHMWASATSVNGFVPKFNRVVIPTHMWASATSYRSVLCFGCFRCYTHSYVGFCNLIIQHLYRKHLKALLYPLICGLLQPIIKISVVIG